MIVRLLKKSKLSDWLIWWLIGRYMNYVLNELTWIWTAWTLNYIQLLIIGDFGLFGKHLWVLDYFSVDIGLYKINFHEVKFSFRDYELQETGFKLDQRQLNEMDWESSSFNQPSVKEDKQKNLLLEMYLMFATHALSILTQYLSFSSKLTFNNRISFQINNKEYR